MNGGPDKPALPTVKTINEKRLSKARESLINSSLYMSMESTAMPSYSLRNYSKKFFGGGNSNTSTRRQNKRPSMLQPRRQVTLQVTHETQEDDYHHHRHHHHHSDLKNQTSANSLSSSFDNDELIYDQVDPNIVYSVSSLHKHYVHGEQYSFDPNEGFLDLHCVKHIRLGCLDNQVFSNMQQLAAKYAISNFDSENVISIIYGTVFSENR